MTNNLTGIIREATLVTLTDTPKELEGCRILCGTVSQDFQGRFKPGNWFYSSMVMTVEGDLVSTLNSVYRVEGDMEQVTLPWSALPVLQQGAPPQALKALKEKGFRHVGGDELYDGG